MVWENQCVSNERSFINIKTSHGKGRAYGSGNGAIGYYLRLKLPFRGIYEMFYLD